MPQRGVRATAVDARSDSARRGSPAGRCAETWMPGRYGHAAPEPRAGERGLVAEDDWTRLRLPAAAISSQRVRCYASSTAVAADRSSRRQRNVASRCERADRCGVTPAATASARREPRLSDRLRRRSERAAAVLGTIAFATGDARRTLRDRRRPCDALASPTTGESRRSAPVRRHVPLVVAQSPLSRRVGHRRAERMPGLRRRRRRPRPAARPARTPARVQAL